MNSTQFTQEQQDKIQKVQEISNQTKEKVIKVLQGNNWQVEMAIDFLTNAGSFIEDPNNILQQQPKISQQNNYQLNPVPIKQQQNNTNPSQSNNPNDVQKQKNDIKKIEEQLQLIYNQEWETSEIVQAKNQMLEKSLNQNIGHALKRIYQLPVGLVNIGKTGYFNCIIQILVQNPSFLEKVLIWKSDLKPYNQEDQNISFIMELQMILRMLTFTNQRFLNHNKFIQKTFEIIDTLTQIKIFNKNLKPHEFFEIFIITLDVVLCNRVYEKKESKKLLDPILSNQFQMIQKSIHEITLNFIREDRYLYLSLLKLVCQDQFIMFQKLPQTFSFSLGLKQNNNSQISQSKMDYWLPFTIDLEFLINENICKQLINTLQNAVNDKTIGEINQKQKLLDSLIIVEQSYEQNKIIPINVLEQLRIERKNIQNELQKYILLNDGLTQTENQNYKYYLHAAVIQIDKNDQQHFYVYIYNFTLNQWYRYNDIDVRVESNEIVKKDIQQNGCYFVYVSQNQMNIIKHHQEKQFKISTNLDLEQGIINWNELELNQLIKPLIPKEIKKIIQNQNEGFQDIGQ